MNGRKGLTAILRKDRVTRLIFGGMLMDGLLLISMLALVVSLAR